MPYTIEFKFSHGTVVKVKGIDVEGVVDAVLFDGYRAEYKVIYWYNSERRVDWLYEYEIEAK